MRLANGYRGARRNAMRGWFDKITGERHVGTIRYWGAAGRAKFYADHSKYPRAKHIWDSIMNRWLTRRGLPPEHKNRRQIERQTRNNPTAGRITIAELEARTS